VEGWIVSVVDHKPKRSADLRRLRNIAANPTVSVLVGQYEEDWDRLWWVRADGRGRIVSEGSEYRDALAALVAKYHHYKDNPPAGPVIVVDVERVTGWTAGQ
jgi:PPOX class probable F420-dependent enzyme